MTPVTCSLERLNPVDRAWVLDQVRYFVGRIPAMRVRFGVDHAEEIMLSLIQQGRLKLFVRLDGSVELKVWDFKAKEYR